MSKAHKNEILAWCNSPLPDGTNYFGNDLSTESKVRALLVHCREGHAIILAKGWDFLCQEYGLLGILQMDSKIGWQKKDDKGEWLCALVHQSLNTGFHPLINAYGDFDENEMLFLLHDGSKLKVDWNEIIELAQ